MPKLKSNRGAAKRFKCTATGKVKHRQAYKSHILTKKSAKRKRHLRHLTTMSPSDVPTVARLLPYSF